MTAADTGGGGDDERDIATHLTPPTTSDVAMPGLEVIENDECMPVGLIPATSPILEIISEDNSAAPMPVELIAASIEEIGSTRGSENENAVTDKEDVDPIRMSDVETVIIDPPRPVSMVKPQDSAKDPDLKALAFDIKDESMKKIMEGSGHIVEAGAGRGSEAQGLDDNILLSTSTTGDRRMGNSHYPSVTDEESLLVVAQDGTLVERFTVLEATIVDDVVYDAVPFTDQDDKSSQGLRKRQTYCALVSLVLLAAMATGITVAVLKSNSTPSTPNIEIKFAPDGLRADWVECTDSNECSNGCCSGTFSQGVFTCTPLDGGYLPGTCVGEGERKEESRGDWVDCNSSLQCTNGCCSNAYSEGFYKCTPLIGGYLGDPEICISHLEESKGWEECTNSDECSTGCCSSTYSDGVPKCTPLVGGYRNDTCVGKSVKEEDSIGDWVECSSSLQCTNGCCSNAYSEGFWKCTPLIGGYLGDPEICMSHAEESKGWNECTTSNECSTGCCSSTYSEGVLKCTPLYGGYRNDTCVGVDAKEEDSVGDWVECSSSLQCTNGCCSNAYSEGFWKCTPLIGGYLGDPEICMSHLEESKGWEECTTSDECSTGCCSSTYSEGVLKCTPLYGGYRNDTCVGKSVKEEDSIGDWVECSSSLQCTNGCCSNAYSEGFWKCTPLIGGYLGDPEICMSHAEESKGWNECTTSDECSTGCCSSTYSEGVLKCTPLYGGYRNDTCVGEEL